MSAFNAKRHVLKERLDSCVVGGRKWWEE